MHTRGCVQWLGENVLADTKWKVRDKAKCAAGRPWEGGDGMRCPGAVAAQAGACTAPKGRLWPKRPCFLLGARECGEIAGLCRGRC